MKKIYRIFMCFVISFAMYNFYAYAADIPEGYRIDNLNNLMNEADVSSDADENEEQQLPLMTDGDESTAGTIHGTYVLYDFADTKYIANLSCKYYDRKGDYTVSISDDGVTYREICNFSGTASAADKKICDTGTIDVYDKCRYVKITRSGNGSKIISIVELMARECVSDSQFPKGMILDSKNVLLGGTVTTDGDEAQPKERIIDGVKENNLAVVKKATYIEITLAQETRIGGVNCIFRDDIGEYSISVSRDGKKYKTLGTYVGHRIEGNIPWGEKSETGLITTDARIKYIRITRTNGAGTFGVYELEAYSFIPAYQITKVSNNVTVNSLIEITLNDDDFAATGTDVFTVKNASTGEIINSKIERKDGYKFYVACGRYLKYNEEIEVDFSDKIIKKYADKDKPIYSNKQKITVASNLINCVQDGENIKITNNSTSSVNITAFVISFDETGKVIGCVQHDSDDVQSETSIPCQAVSGASSVRVPVFVRSGSSLIPIDCIAYSVSQ